MKTVTLLSRLQALQAVDFSFFSAKCKTALYQQRAEQLWALGLDFFARLDFQQIAMLCPKESVNIERLLQQYQAEQNTIYYREWRYLLQGNALLKQGAIPANLYTAFGGTFALLGLYHMAVRHYQYGQAFRHNQAEYAALCKDYGMLINLLGGNGWQLYEQRWLTKDAIFANNEDRALPQWQGESLENKTVLVYAEQGLGDSLQFVRYAIWLKQQGVNVCVRNHFALENYLAFNLAQYGIPTLTGRANVDVAVAMMSLPALVTKDPTNPEAIPFRSSYLFVEKTAFLRWQQKLSANRKRKIGFVFQGSPTNTKDHLRSIPLAAFARLFELEAEFHCLQKMVTEQDKQTLAQWQNVYCWESDIHDFFDTSALITQMDLVITIDSAVAHLSAALGKPTWILINYNPDFRWYLESETSLWYQSVRLFRQALDYSWQNVLEKVSQALQKTLSP